MKLKLKIVADKQYPNMYWLIYDDGSVSTDFYNKTRVKHEMARIQAEKLAGEFYAVQATPLPATPK